MSRTSGIRVSVAPSGISRSSNVGLSRRQAPRHMISVDQNELNSQSSIPIFSDDGTANACPECKTSRIGRPDLKLLYSKCCGRVICDACCVRLFSRPSDCQTPNCGARLDRQSWETEPLDVHRFKTETTQRRIYAEHLTLEREDFDSQERFDDYCEEIQDFVYDFSCGNEAMKREAESRRKQIEAKYQTEIQNSKNRKIQKRDYDNMTETLKYLHEKAVLKELDREKRDKDQQNRKKLENLRRRYEDIARRACVITVTPNNGKSSEYRVDDYGNIDPERKKLMKASGFVDFGSLGPQQSSNHAFFLGPL